MYTTDLEVFKTQQQELHRRAAHYRLLRSLQKTTSPLAKLSNAVGSALILLGQEMIRRAETVTDQPVR